MDVLTIIKNFLMENGYDGLYSEEDTDCACRIDDLCACGEIGLLNCKPGIYAPDPSGEFDYLIVPKK